MAVRVHTHYLRSGMELWVAHVWCPDQNPAEFKDL